MTKENAIEVLLQVAELAQTKGILSLQDAAIVHQAVTALQPVKEEMPETVGEFTEEVKPKTTKPRK